MGFFKSAADSATERRKALIAVRAMARKIERIRREASGDKEKGDGEEDGPKGFETIAEEFQYDLQQLVDQRPEMELIRDHKKRRKLKKREYSRTEVARANQEWRERKKRAEERLQEMHDHDTVGPVLDKKQKMEMILHQECGENADPKERKKLATTQKKIQKKYDKMNTDKIVDGQKIPNSSAFAVALSMQQVVDRMKEQYNQIVELPGEEMAEAEREALDNLKGQVGKLTMGLDQFLDGDGDGKGKRGGVARKHLKAGADGFADEGDGGGGSAGGQTEEERQMIMQMEAEQKEVEERQNAILGNILNCLGELKQKQLIIKDQLQQSEELINKADKKLDECQKGLDGLNKQTGKILDQQSSNMRYTYVACCLLITALMGMVVMQMGLVPEG